MKILSKASLKPLAMAAATLMFFTASAVQAIDCGNYCSNAAYEAANSAAKAAALPVATAAKASFIASIPSTCAAYGPNAAQCTAAMEAYAGTAYNNAYIQAYGPVYTQVYSQVYNSCMGQCR